MRWPALVLIGAFAATAAVLQSSADARPSASRVFDRTFQCPITSSGVREIDIEARSGTRDFTEKSKWWFPSQIEFSAQRGTARRYVGGSMTVGGPFVAREAGSSNNTLVLGASCMAVTSRASLASTGLSGGPASQFDDEYECVVPAKILVRVRVAFHTSTSVRPRSGYFTATERIREGTIAIRTLTGKPIALATAHESGRARLFVGSTCGPDG